MKLLVILLAAVAAAAAATVDDHHIYTTCPARYASTVLFSDQAEFDAAKVVEVPRPIPMKQRLWWALTTYEHYYTFEYGLKQHVPHFDAKLDLSAEIFQREFRAHGQPVVIDFASLRHLGYKTRTWQLEDLLAKYPLNSDATDATDNATPYKANTLHPTSTDDAQVVDLSPGLHAIARNAPLNKTADGHRNFARNLFFASGVLHRELGYQPPPPLLLGEDSAVLTLDTLWMGSNSTTADTPLHHDGSDNFMTMLCGTKTVALVPPTDWRLLNPDCNQQSGLCHARVARDPTDTRALIPPGLHVLTVTLRAGEILYVPAGWFHFVHNTEPTVMVNNWTLMTNRQAVGLVKTMMDEDDEAEQRK